ncbi:MAG TPA: MOSC domain-containing protein [Candidatus Methylacidiphilales bacterium]|nr:MOSC domain-containing protein [Candidatus Methylacidiphilales bacterium]
MLAEIVKAGVVGALYRFPVKSMMGEELNAVSVGGKGIAGDRLFALSDPATGKIASAKNPSKWPNLFSFHATYTEPLNGGKIPSIRITLPNGDTILSDATNLNDVLSQTLGKPVQFLSGAPASGTLEEYWPDIEGLARRNEVTDEAMPAETFFDIGMVHIITTATLDELRKFYPEGRVEARRFRPNIVVTTPPEVTGFAEKDWVGKILSIGDTVKLKVTIQCGRCVMTTLAQADLPKDAGILRTAVKHNGAHVGIYASVIQGGKIRRGDTVQVADE